MVIPFIKIERSAKLFFEKLSSSIFNRTILEIRKRQLKFGHNHQKFQICFISFHSSELLFLFIFPFV